MHIAVYQCSTVCTFIMHEPMSIYIFAVSYIFAKDLLLLRHEWHRIWVWS